MLTIRRGGERGLTDWEWLYSLHTFSFGRYHDPHHMGISVLRVINDDQVQPGAGFATHGHEDMEIISYVLHGAIEHQDSMGHIERLTAGEFQLMTAGTGVTHSEYNASDIDPFFLDYPAAQGRILYLHVFRGTLMMQDQPLQAGDGASLTQEHAMRLRATIDAEVLLFDLP